MDFIEDVIIDTEVMDMGMDMGMGGMGGMGMMGMDVGLGMGGMGMGMMGMEVGMLAVE